MGAYAIAAAAAVIVTAAFIKIQNMEVDEQMANANQTQLVLDYMKTHGSIDQLRAANDLGCFRLAARIADLKAAGVPIYRKIKTNPETGKRWAEYWTQ